MPQNKRKKKGRKENQLYSKLDVSIKSLPRAQGAMQKDYKRTRWQQGNNTFPHRTHSGPNQMGSQSREKWTLSPIPCQEVASKRQPLTKENLVSPMESHQVFKPHKRTGCEPSSIWSAQNELSGNFGDFFLKSHIALFGLFKPYWSFAYIS